MNRLLVATDFSARSDRALRRASLVAQKLGARLTLSMWSSPIARRLDSG